MDKRDSKLRGHLRYFLRDAKVRAKKKNLKFNLDLDYLESIVVDRCPVLGTEFIFGLGSRGLSPASPSLDRTIPSEGYVKGNVSFISHRANTMKHNSTSPTEFRKLADWLESKLEAWQSLA